MLHLSRYYGNTLPNYGSSAGSLLRNVVYSRTKQILRQDVFQIQCELMTIIPDLSDLVIEQVSMTNEVTITVRAASPTAPCPCCGTICKRIQSRYTRTLSDLPASGRPVHLVIRVRRFFCQESTCVRKNLCRT